MSKITEQRKNKIRNRVSAWLAVGLLALGYGQACTGFTSGSSNATPSVSSVGPVDPVISVPVPTASPSPTASPTPGVSGSIAAQLGYGVNIGGLNGSPDVLPGYLYGQVYITPETHFAYHAGKGVQQIRIEGEWERFQPRLNGALGEQLLDHYNDPNNPLRNPVTAAHSYLALAKKYNMKVVLDFTHNYGRRYVGYNGNWNSKQAVEVGSGDCPVSAWADYEVKLVQEFGSDPTVFGIEIMNEPHDMAIGTQGYADAVQTVITAIRKVNTSIYIFVDGYGWASAVGWPGLNPTLQNLKDPSSRIVFTAHSYFDQSGAGVYTGSEASNPMDTNYDIGAQRLAPFTNWLKQYGLQDQGAMTEYGAPNSAKWGEIVRRTLIAGQKAGLAMSAHMDVPAPNDPYIMNLYPADGQPDRYTELLLESVIKKTSYLNTPLAN